MSLPLDISAIWPTTICNDICLGFSEEFSEISPLNLFILKLLHNLISNIISFLREHLRLVLFAVELAHGL